MPRQAGKPKPSPPLAAPTQQPQPLLHFTAPHTATPWIRSHSNRLAQRRRGGVSLPSRLLASSDAPLHAGHRGGRASDAQPDRRLLPLRRGAVLGRGGAQPGDLRLRNPPRARCALLVPHLARPLPPRRAPPVAPAHARQLLLGVRSGLPRRRRGRGGDARLPRPPVAPLAPARVQAVPRRRPPRRPGMGPLARALPGLRVPRALVGLLRRRRRRRRDGPRGWGPARCGLPEDPGPAPVRPASGPPLTAGARLATRRGRRPRPQPHHLGERPGQGAGDLRGSRGPRPCQGQGQGQGQVRRQQQGEGEGPG